MIAANNRSIDSGLLIVNTHASIHPVMMSELTQHDIDALTLGQYISYLRRREGLTQEQLAEQIPFSQKWISDLERGVYKHSKIENLRILAEFFGVNETDLIIKAGFANANEGANRLGKYDADKRTAIRQSVTEKREELKRLADKLPASDLDWAISTLRRFARGA